LSPTEDHIIEQGWESYSQAEHAIWRQLFERQARLLPGRVAPAFLDGLKGLEVAAEGIPDFRRLSDILDRTTGWQVVSVPGLIPDDVFFRHLAARRFPATNWIRKPEQMDYLPEPDVFHDVFGHVPLLMDPVFANYLQAYGEAGALAAAGLRGSLTNLARLYWYTVEFGLIVTNEGLRIYGAGIVSSESESVFCLDSPSPNRVMFDLLRVMRTNYRIDDYQETYFVIDDFKRLYDMVDQDFLPVYAQLAGLDDLEPGQIIPEDTVLSRGTGAYHAAKSVA
jgi:phenylalanine-4-hydroxylase